MRVSHERQVATEFFDIDGEISVRGASMDRIQQAEGPSGIGRLRVLSLVRCQKLLFDRGNVTHYNALSQHLAFLAPDEGDSGRFKRTEHY